jgi:hypothetical protein
MPRSVVFQLPRSYRFAVLALLQLALATLLLLQALHLNALALSIGQSSTPVADTIKQAVSQQVTVETGKPSPLLSVASLDGAALAARLPRRPPMRAPARRTIFETVERRWKEYRLLGTQRFA